MKPDCSPTRRGLSGGFRLVSCRHCVGARHLGRVDQSLLLLPVVSENKRKKIFFFFDCDQEPSQNFRNRPQHISFVFTPGTPWAKAVLVDFHQTRVLRQRRQDFFFLVRENHLNEQYLTRIFTQQAIQCLMCNFIAHSSQK